MTDTGSGWWTSGGDGRWYHGDPPAGWVQASDGRWYPPAPPPPVPPPPPWSPASNDREPTQWGTAQDDDGEWEETQAYQPAHLHAAAPSGVRGVADTYRSWPRWARIAAPVTAAFIGLGALGAAVDQREDPDDVEVAAQSTTTSESTSTTEERVTTTVASTTTTAPPTTTTTAPPPPPTTAPPPPPQTEPEVSPPPPPPSPPPSGDCHPSYDPCVPIASDVDCLGGSGNGPEYVGMVTVIGPDVYDLDRDGDGVGCE